MSGKLFLKNRLPVILLNLLGALALSLFLLAVGNDIQTILFILAAWMLVLALYLAAGYASRKKRLEKLLEIAGQLKERYLLPEVMPVPDQAEEQVYYQLLKLAGKSMLERIGEVERERGEYRTYRGGAGAGRISDLHRAVGPRGQDAHHRAEAAM